MVLILLSCMMSAPTCKAHCQWPCRLRFGLAAHRPEPLESATRVAWEAIVIVTQQQTQTQTQARSLSPSELWGVTRVSLTASGPPPPPPPGPGPGSVRARRVAEAAASAWTVRRRRPPAALGSAGIDMPYLKRTGPGAGRKPGRVAHLSWRSIRVNLGSVVDPRFAARVRAKRRPGRGPQTWPGCARQEAAEARLSSRRAQTAGHRYYLFI